MPLDVYAAHTKLVTVQFGAVGRLEHLEKNILLFLAVGRSEKSVHNGQICFSFDEPGCGIGVISRGVGKGQVACILVQPC